MKKILLFVAVATLASGTMVSCGKSSKGKMEGEWNLDSMSNTSTSSNGSSTSTSTMSVEGTTITQSQTSGGTTVTQTGVVNSSSFKINKDGTWERMISYTFSGTGYSNTKTITSSGTWDFAKGVSDDYKKNERVIFCTLSESSKEDNTVGSSTTSSTDTDTYLDGENTQVFVITESKSKSLSMEAKGSNTSTNSGSSGSSTYTEETTFKLSM